ncbi:putative oxidoreductase YusZ [Grifola frondosa]|uniref:Putative oxidoreductase YusZ n=1 Tax=Grifola frondosa TaxID=5627 RepID=A0A1C7M565_GRIFR|nr:putative oxidoreductase YusZ [Grifola frondosa]
MTFGREKTTLVWFITGTSSGFGRRLVHIALNRGDFVIATARSLTGIQDFPQNEKLRLLQLDVTDGLEVIKHKVDEAVTYFGRIDVLVNNAGVGMMGFIEEGGSEHFRKQFQPNFYGMLDITTAALPHMRMRRSGTVVIIGSRSSWSAEAPGSGSYAASKAAARVMGETLAAEVAAFSIRVLIVEPGAFCTEKIFSDPSCGGSHMPDYDGMRLKAEATCIQVRSQLSGDPAKAMELLADVVRNEGKAKGKPWPLYLPLGEAAEVSIRNKCQKMLDVLDEWKDVICDTKLDGP